jgi:hypothetical protein
MHSKWKNAFTVSLFTFGAVVKGQFNGMTAEEWHQYNANRTLSLGYVRFILTNVKIL